MHIYKGEIMPYFIIFLMLGSISFGLDIKTTDDRSHNLRNITKSWNTNWNKHTVQYSEILSGGPPRDGIPSIDNPKFINADKAKSWINDNEPIVFVKIGLHVKAYPIQILIWHEIVNDTIGDKKITVTFCPLCNSTIVFDRTINGKVYDFGTSGLLRKSDLVMYDRQSETLWQQFTGQAIIGDMAGVKLKILPSSMLSFKDYYTAYPDGLVLSKETGYMRAYGQNPYMGYDDINSSPFLYRNSIDKRLKPMERVVTLSSNSISKAYPYTVLQTKKVINDKFAGKEIVIFHKSGMVSALDKSSILNSKDIGSTAVFSASLDGKTLKFTYDKNRGIIDINTGSTWNIFGAATSGMLKGKELTREIHADHFWFSFAAFKPKTKIYK